MVDFHKISSPNSFLNSFNIELKTTLFAAFVSHLSPDIQRSAETASRGVL